MRADYMRDCPFRKEHYDENCSVCEAYGKSCSHFDDHGPSCLFAEDLQFRSNFYSRNGVYWDGFEFLAEDEEEETESESISNELDKEFNQYLFGKNHHSLSSEDKQAKQKILDYLTEVFVRLLNTIFHKFEEQSVQKKKKGHQPEGGALSLYLTTSGSGCSS